MCSCKKLNGVILLMRFVGHISISGVSIWFHTFVKNCHNSIKLCRNKSKKVPRLLNNDEWNQAIGKLNAGMSATVVSQHFGCTRKTIEHLRRQFLVTGKFANHPWNDRPCETHCCHDCYIVLQHLRYRHLTAAATRRQYGIHPVTVRNRLRQNAQSICVYQPYFNYFGKILTRRHWRARRYWCHHHLRFGGADWDLILFSDECRFNLSHADTQESLSPWGRPFCRCINELAVALQAEWANLPAPFIQRYVNSMHRRITACIAQNGGHMRYWHISSNLQSLFVSWYPSKWIKTSPVRQLCLTKLSVISEIEPYVISLDFFQWKNYRSNFKAPQQRMSL